MKYRVVYKNSLTNGTRVLAENLKTPAAALDIVKQDAILLIRDLLGSGLEVRASQTSDSRYPDAWGYANNGIEIICNCQYYDFIAEEQPEQ